MAVDWTTLGKDAIPGDNPAGMDVRYESEFETLQAEIDKLASPTASSQVDWATIVNSAAKILSEKSKDLMVASYLAAGLIRTRQIDGLDNGIQILKDLVETHWDHLYPLKKRMRGRVGALTWWIERTHNELQKLTPKPLPPDQIQRIKDNLKRIYDLLLEKMPEEPPSFSSVQRVIESLPVEKQSLKEAPAQPQAPKTPEAEPANAPAAPKAAAARAATVAEAPEAIASDQDARKTVDIAFQKLRQASLFLLQKDLKDPSAYRYRRLSSWAKIQALPPHTDGKTQIPPPPPQLVDTLNQLRDDANWPALIENTEQKVSQYVFWFDLNRFVAEALADSGPEYQNALATVCIETSAFLQRLPGVDNLTFADETPFADPETRRWLQGVRGGEGVSQTATAPSPEAGAGSDDQVQSLVQKAKALARKKQLSEAVAMLQQQMHQTPSRYRQMQWRLGIAEVLLSVKKTQSALPHLETILEDIDAFRIEQWDPRLALEGLKTAWQAFSGQTTNEYKERTLTLLSRIAGLDPVEALRLSK